MTKYICIFFNSEVDKILQNLNLNMATLIRVVRGIGQAVQKAHREQERQAKRLYAEHIRLGKVNLRKLC